MNFQKHGFINLFIINQKKLIILRTKNIFLTNYKSVIIEDYF